MRTVLLILTTNYFSLSFSLSTSLKNNDVVSLSNIRALLSNYKGNHGGNLPKNWQSFIDSGILSGSVLEDARNYLDVESRYRFINCPTLFSSSGRAFRIIVMANGPGGEGDREIIAENGHVEKSPGRYIIIETENGMIETGRYSEAALKYIFQEAKLNLEDFTSALPPLPEFRPPPKDPSSEGMALGGPENPSAPNTRAAKNTSQRESKPRSTHSENDVASIGSSPWINWIVGGISAIGVLTLAWVFRRFFLSRSLGKR